MNELHERLKTRIASLKFSLRAILEDAQVLYRYGKKDLLIHSQIDICENALEALALTIGTDSAQSERDDLTHAADHLQNALRTIEGLFSKNGDRTNALHRAYDHIECAQHDLWSACTISKDKTAKK